MVKLDDIIELQDQGIIDIDNDPPEKVIKDLCNELTVDDYYYCPPIQAYNLLHNALGDDFVLPDEGGKVFYYIIKKSNHDQLEFFGSNLPLIQDYYTTSIMDVGMWMPWGQPVNATMTYLMFESKEDAETVAQWWMRQFKFKNTPVKSVYPHSFTPMPGQWVTLPMEVEVDTQLIPCKIFMKR